MADAEMTEGWVPRDERRCDEEIAIQVLDVIRRWLLLVLVTFPPHALEWQQRSTELLQISQFLFGSLYKRRFGTFVYSYQLVLGRNRKRQRAAYMVPDLCRAVISCHTTESVLSLDRHRNARSLAGFPAPWPPSPGLVHSTGFHQPGKQSTSSSTRVEQVGARVKLFPVPLGHAIHRLTWCLGRIP